MPVLTRSRARRPPSPKRSPKTSSPPKEIFISNSPLRSIKNPRNVAKKTTSVSAAAPTRTKSPARQQDFKEWLKNVSDENAKRVRGVKIKEESNGSQFEESEEDIDAEEEVTSDEDSEDEEEEDDSLTNTDEGEDGEEETDSSVASSDELELNFRPARIRSTLPPSKRRTKRGSERKARGITTEDRQLIRRMIHENKEPAVIVNTANFKPLKRRVRIDWTPAEVLNLRLGVERFGLAWSQILTCSDFKFHPHRTQVDLKDKWRNITDYRPYGSRGKRGYLLLDQNHQPVIRPDTGKPYRFTNRWPRDAALKAASRDDFYEDGKSTCTIYVREVNGTEDQERAIPPIVHVYEGTRIREVAPPHLSEINIRTVWSADVRKIREERFISPNDLKLIEYEAALNNP